MNKSESRTHVSWVSRFIVITLFVFTTVLLTACEKNDELAVKGVIVIDSSLDKDATMLTPFIDGSPERHIGVVVSPNGNTFRIIEEEILLAVKSPAELSKFLDTMGGTVLASWDFAQVGDKYGVSYHAIRLDTSRVSVDDLETVLKALNLSDSVRVSSNASHLTLAAYATASRLGIAAMPNIVMESQQISTSTTTEAVSAVDIFAADYTRNAFEWPYMKLGGPLDIGVAEAWRALDANSKLSERVPVLVMDGGFRNTQELPADTVLVGRTRYDVPNADDCSGVGCDWHGTMVTHVMAAKVDDSFGGAGTGGPVVQPHLLQAPASDFFEFIRYMAGIVDGLSAARIVNISASATVDQWVCDMSGFFMGTAGVCAAPHFLGASLRAAGYLVIASAGNQSRRDLDSGDFTMPCEMIGTLCVGGMRWDGPYRDGGSSYASRRMHGAIDLWAPMRVWVGPDDGDLTANQVHIAGGTSVSAPFVSGVAALVSAANRSLNGDQIEAILLSSAHVGAPAQVHRWINAYGAVSQALNGQVPPAIHIVSPMPETIRANTPTLRFEASVTPAGVEPPVTTWYSSVDGELGTGEVLMYTGRLRAGVHTITAVATANGVSSSDAVVLTLTNNAPVVQIVSPEVRATIYANQEFTLTGTSFDQNEIGGRLTDAQMSWYVGELSLGNGHSVDVPANTLAPGNYALRLVGSDGYQSHEARRAITILPNATTSPPAIGAITPASGTTHIANNYADGNYVLLTLSTDNIFAGTVAGIPYFLPDGAFSWSTTYNGITAYSQFTEHLGTGRVLNNAKLKHNGTCGLVEHKVKLTVTKNGVSNSKTVVYYVDNLC
ncbi:MAG: S8 family serine peptidase [Gammaproteobacteria bacterium]|nr:S8 family serine peptidase [Gammaproteobacteria bacterium]